jgi:hypothetical protein
MDAPDSRIDPIAIDVHDLVRRSVASLYSHLVTRPTGRAVRMAIEAQLADQRAGTQLPALSLIDLSEVAVLDFSCADEVVAKLLARYLPEDRPMDAFFVFRGLQAPHREAIEIVLRRQALAAVAELERGRFGLIGEVAAIEQEVWRRIDAHGRVRGSQLAGICTDDSERAALAELVGRRLIVPFAGGRELCTLAALARTAR